jgi:hypothetical protein
VKNWKMGLVVAAAVPCLVTVLACSSSSGSGGGGDICTQKGNCPNDTAPTQSQIDQCHAAQNDAKCGSKFGALASCAEAHQSCGADGKTTTGTACQQEGMDYANCVLMGLDAGGGG